MKIIENTFEAHKKMLESKLYWCVNPLNSKEILISENEIKVTGSERQIAYANALVWRRLNRVIDQIQTTPNSQDEISTDKIMTTIEGIINTINEEYKTAHAVIDLYK